MHATLYTLVRRYPELSPCIKDIQYAVEILANTFCCGGKLLICGNGGSAADCEHMVGELMKGFRLQRPISEEVRCALIQAFAAEGSYVAERLQGALPAISLVSQTALSTATVNDIGAEMVFAQQIYGYGRSGDAILGISTSGRSNNVKRAFQVGKIMNIRCIALVGSSSDTFSGLCDVIIHTPARTTADVQELHLPIYHAICSALEDIFFREAYRPHHIDKTSRKGELNVVSSCNIGDRLRSFQENFL